MTRVGGCNNEIAALPSDHYTEVSPYYCIYTIAIPLPISILASYLGQSGMKDGNTGMCQNMIITSVSLRTLWATVSRLYSPTSTRERSRGEERKKRRERKEERRERKEEGEEGGEEGGGRGGKERREKEKEEM